MAGVLIALASAVAAGVLSRVLPLGPLGETLDSTWSNLFPVARTPIDAAVRLRLWGQLEHDAFLEKLQHHGYGNDVAEQILNSARVFMDASLVIRHGWRAEKTDEEITAELVNHGWNEVDAAAHVFAAHPFPSMGDIVTWVAHEVYEPDAVAKYGLDDELGRIERGDAYKIGMTDEQIRNYWRSHWVHPSYTQVAQMVHRGHVNEQEMSDWFRLVEIPPYWRDNLIKLIYRTYTRVDVRRMHKVGVLDDNDLLRAYLDYGYNRERAEGMKEFTILYNAAGADGEKRELTRASLEKARRYGVLSDTEFVEALEDMGYEDDDAELLGGLVEQDMNLEQVSAWMTILRSQVKSGLITAQDAGLRLSALGLASEVVDMYVELFQAYAEEPDKIPSKTDVKDWFKKHLIEPHTAREYLAFLGYAPVYIDLYIQAWEAG